MVQMSTLEIRILAIQLCICVKRGQSNVVKVLLQYGADINAVNNDGDTALRVAASIGCSGIEKLLRAHGAK